MSGQPPEFSRTVTIDTIQSSPDPDNHFPCAMHGKACHNRPTQNTEVGYALVTNNIRFLFPQVWMNVCLGCGSNYTHPDVAAQIGDAILRTAHPRRARMMDWWNEDMAAEEVEAETS